MGPGEEGRGKSWLIDGIADDSPVGTVYQIKFYWSFSWESGENKRITWQVIDSSHAQIECSTYAHTYSAVGSWNTWRFQQMVPSETVDNAWELKITMGVLGREEFQIVRDRDWAQVIHPPVARAMKPKVPVMGPDDEGAGKNWQIRAPAGETVAIQLRVTEAETTVTVSNEKKRQEDLEQHRFE